MEMMDKAKIIDNVVEKLKAELRFLEGEMLVRDVLITAGYFEIVEAANKVFCELKEMLEEKSKELNLSTLLALTDLKDALKRAGVLSLLKDGDGE